jgi:hypothetical protein
MIQYFILRVLIIIHNYIFYILLCANCWFGSTNTSHCTECVYVLGFVRLIVGGVSLVRICALAVNFA